MPVLQGRQASDVSIFNLHIGVQIRYHWAIMERKIRLSKSKRRLDNIGIRKSSWVFITDGVFPMVRTRRRRQKRLVVAESQDYLLNVAYDQHDNLSMVYRTFAEKKPIILFDIQEQRIYAYPCKEFGEQLGSERSRRMLNEQYKKALLTNQMVVFVRDNDNEKLVSFSLDWQ